VALFRCQAINPIPMFTRSTSVRLKIVGAEGLSAEDIRAEVDRGARLVIYTYCISIVVVTFKRSSDIYFVKPGQSCVVKGLPYTLLSLLLGWWGIPWGFVYTIEALIVNLRGGKDITRELVAALSPQPTTSPALPASEPTAAVPVLPRVPIRPKTVLRYAAIAVALVALIYAGVCYHCGNNLKVALISGLPSPYAFELNGTSHRITPGNPAIITMPEGEIVIKGAPGSTGERRVTLSTPFLSRPFAPHIAVINPDRLAVVYRETVQYHPTGTPADPNEKASYAFFANELTYLFPEPDYFFTNFPTSLRMPSGTQSMSKTRLHFLENPRFATTAAVIKEQLGYPAALAHLRQAARLRPEDEWLQQMVVYMLEPADARSLLESRLTDRPVLIEWHRTYQYFMERSFPDFDLGGQYRRWADAEPDDGGLLYLYARTIHDPVKSSPLFERALHAARPSMYAAYGLAVDAFAEGDYPRCYELLQQAERGGIRSESLQLRLRETLLALGRTREVLASARAARNLQPNDPELFADELRLAQSIAPDRLAGTIAVTEFLGRLRKPLGPNADLKPVENLLLGELAYSGGDENGAATYLEKVPEPVHAFEAAIDRRDLAAAERALQPVKRKPMHFHWILYLAAYAVGDTAAAEKYFQQGVEALRHEDRQEQEMAQVIAAGNLTAYSTILRTSNFALENRVLFTALGVRFPSTQAAYFERARQLNHDPAFPCLLLRSFLDPKKPPSSPPEQRPGI